MKAQYTKRNTYLDQKQSIPLDCRYIFRQTLTPRQLPARRRSLPCSNGNNHLKRFFFLLKPHTRVTGNT